MEQCLDLSTTDQGWRNLELILYAPWIIFAVTWVLSFVFYDAVLFFSSIFLNYFIYAHTTYLARGFAWLSPASKTCANSFYDIYRYQWPNPTLVTVTSYTLVMFLYHWRQRQLWWVAAGRATGNGWNWLRRILLILTITLPPILIVLTLLALDIQTPLALTLNLMLAFTAAVLSLHLFGKLRRSETMLASLKQQFV